MNPSFAHFQKLVSNPLRFCLFLLKRLPAAFFAGLSIKELDEQRATITVKYSWFNRNPFKSMYFAIQSMAAEMSTGILGFAQVHRRIPSVSMLVTGIEGRFYKKALGEIRFTCKSGADIEAAVMKTIATGERVTVRCDSVGKNEAGETVAVFIVEWSFKVRE